MKTKIDDIYATLTKNLESWYSTFFSLNKGNQKVPPFVLLTREMVDRRTNVLIDRGNYA